MRISDYIDRRCETILTAWCARARGQTRAADRPPLVLLDHLPLFLAELATALRDPGDAASEASVSRCAEQHALERLADDVDLHELVREYHLLRAVVCEGFVADAGELRDLPRFDAALDRAIARSVERYTAAQARLHEATTRRRLAYERIATAAADVGDLDGLLRQLLEVFLATATGAEAAAILLREGDRLRVHAALGVSGEPPDSCAVGEGFAGRIAESRAPIAIDDLRASSVQVNDGIQRRGIRALYGVPMIRAGEVVGVAWVGSTSPAVFGDEERGLFDATVQRATSVVAKRMLQDVAASRQAELEAVFEALPHAIFIGTAARFTRFNDAAIRMLGLDADEGARVGPRAIVPRVALRDAETGAPLTADETPFVRALAGERTSREMILRNAATGHDVYAWVAAAPIVVRGEVTGAVAVAMDVSDRVRVRRQRETFLHSVVHDLRNPLSNVRTIAASTARRLERAGDAASAGRLQRIEANVLRMDRLLSDLLDFELAEGGRLRLQLGDVDVGDLVEEQVVAWGAASRAHDLEVQACHAVVEADPDRVRQVLDNLIGNAVKYSPNGGTVRVTCARVDGAVKISVADQGIGIAPEHQAAVFDPYVRIRAAPAHGAGLGLYVSSQLVRAHGGRIGVESEPGKGATFWFTLPVKRA